jgi:hypothetical protein
MFHCYSSSNNVSGKFIGVALLEENETRLQATRYLTPYLFVQKEPMEPTSNKVGSIRPLGASPIPSLDGLDQILALRLNWRPDANILKVFINPPFNNVKSIENIYSVVNYPKNSDLKIHCTPGGARRFERLDPIMSKYAWFLDDIPPEPSLSDILKGISHFNFYLSQGNIGQPLKQLINVVLHPLKQSNPNQILEEAIYIPDGTTGISLTVDHENIVFAASKYQNLFYGLHMTNNSDCHLFPYLVHFDPSDYSIQVRSWLYSVTCFANLVK